MLVLFDLDGTLSDSAPGIVSSLEHAFRVIDFPITHDLRHSIGPPLKVMLGELDVPLARHGEFIAAYRGRYAEVGLFENTVYDGVVDLLTRLSAAGHSMAVATSKPEPYAVRILEHFGLARRFEVIAGATLDGTRGAKADVIAHCLSQLPSTPVEHTVMIGDRHHDIEGAAHHGIRGIGVTWGYGDRAELEAAGASLVVDTPAELARLM